MKMTKVAALGDLHTDENNLPHIRPILQQIAQQAEILCLSGDLTNHGLASEAELLAKELSTLRLPIVGVLGNHDFESGQIEPLSRVFKQYRIIILDGSSVVVRGIGIAGIKGFAGGFDRHALPFWGEEANKNFVQAAVDESLKLGKALMELTEVNKIALMHYAPIHQTVASEDPEIIPFLGSSKLAAPLDDFQVAAAFHGHSHFGQLEGKTNQGIPVYNTSWPLLQKVRPEQPFVLIEI